jgi:hypothetical protein
MVPPYPHHIRNRMDRCRHIMALIVIVRQRKRAVVIGQIARPAENRVRTNGLGKTAGSDTGS